MERLEAALKEKQKKIKDMEIEVKTVQEFAKTELQNMTKDLIRVNSLIV